MKDDGVVKKRVENSGFHGLFTLWNFALFVGSMVLSNVTNYQKRIFLCTRYLIYDNIINNLA